MDDVQLEFGSDQMITLTVDGGDSDDNNAE